MKEKMANLLAPMQITLPDDQIVAVILGDRSFIKTDWKKNETQPIKRNGLMIESQSINQSNNQSMNRPIDQASKQAINHSIDKLMNQ